MECLSFQKSAVSEEMLLQLGVGGPVGVNDALLIELEGAHDESHQNTEASTRPCDQHHFDAHHASISLHRLLGERACEVVLRLEESVFGFVERSEV